MRAQAPRGTSTSIRIGLFVVRVVLVGVVLGLPTGHVSAQKIDPARAAALWIEAAGQVADLRVKLRGGKVLQSTEPPSRGNPTPATQEWKFDFAIDYLWARPDRESYVHIGMIPSESGLVSYETHTVTFEGAQRDLLAGGAKASRIYDQFVIRAPKAVHETALEPLRFLLNLNHRGEPGLFDGLEFQAVPGTRQTVEGVDCLSLECLEREGFRAWVDPRDPGRIHKLELGLVKAKRQGHVECLYRYPAATGDPPAGDVPPEFVVPREWEMIVYGSRGAVRSWLKCELEAAELNTAPGPERFQLPIPPGAIVADRRGSSPEYFLQLANGTQQPIPRASMGPELLTALSSSVPGSRIENHAAHGHLDVAERRSSLWILLTINLGIFALCGVIYLVTRLRRSRRARDGQEKGVNGHA
jgi:hypothetical protein